MSFAKEIRVLLVPRFDSGKYGHPNLKHLEEDFIFFKLLKNSILSGCLENSVFHFDVMEKKKYFSVYGGKGCLAGS